MFPRSRIHQQQCLTFILLRKEKLLVQSDLSSDGACVQVGEAELKGIGTSGHAKESILLLYTDKRRA
jgi:hypothetical protein